MNGDGVVSPADREALTAALAADGTSISATDPGYIASYDVNGDYRLHAGDLTFLDRLALPERSS